MEDGFSLAFVLGRSLLRNLTCDAEERSISAELPACPKALRFFARGLRMTPAWRESAQLLRLEHDLFAVVMLVLEDVVAMRRLLQRQGVSDDEGRVDLPVLNPLQQRLHVALDMTLPGLDRQRAVHDGTDRKAVDVAAISADHRDSAA